MRTPRRSKVISFRLNESDYQHLCALCESEGTMRVSDYARIVISRRIQEGHIPEPENADRRLQTINEAINEIRTELKRVSAAIEAHTAAQTAAGNS